MSMDSEISTTQPASMQEHLQQQELLLLLPCSGIDVDSYLTEAHEVQCYSWLPS